MPRGTGSRTIARRRGRSDACSNTDFTIHARPCRRAGRTPPAFDIRPSRNSLFARGLSDVSARHRGAAGERQPSDSSSAGQVSSLPCPSSDSTRLTTACRRELAKPRFKAARSSPARTSPARSRARAARPQSPAPRVACRSDRGAPRRGIVKDHGSQAWVTERRLRRGRALRLRREPRAAQRKISPIRSRSSSAISP